MAPSLAVGNLDGEISVWKTSSSCGTWPVLEIWNVYLPTARFVEDSPTRKSLSATGTGAAGVNTLAAGTAGPVVAGAAPEVVAEAAGDRTFRLDSSMARDPNPMAMMLPKMAMAEQTNMTIVRLFLHVLAATVWVGGQLTLAGLVPGLRSISPDAPRAVARRFNMLAWPAYLALVVTGVWNLFAVHATWHGRYGTTLILKVAM